MCNIISIQTAIYVSNIYEYCEKHYLKKQEIQFHNISIHTLQIELHSSLNSTKKPRERDRIRMFKGFTLMLTLKRKHGNEKKNNSDRNHTFETKPTKDHVAESLQGHSIAYMYV